MLKAILLKCFEVTGWLSNWMRLGGIYWPLSDEKWQWWEFGLVLVCFFLFQVDITQRATREKSKLLTAYLLTLQVTHTTHTTHTHTHTHTPHNTHTPTHTHTIFYQAALQFYCVVRLHLSHCVCCRPERRIPAHHQLIVFLILSCYPTSTWPLATRGWTLPLRWT